MPPLSPAHPESFADLAKTLFLGRLDLTVASSSGIQVENPRIAKFRDNPRYILKDPEKGYSDEIGKLKASGCLVDKYGKRVDKEKYSNRILSHVLYQIREVTGKDIVPQTKDFTAAANLARRVIKFSHASKLTASRMDVDMAVFVTDLLKEVGWEGMGAEKGKKLTAPPPPPAPIAPPHPVEIPLPEYMRNSISVRNRKDHTPWGNLEHGKKLIVPIYDEGVEFVLPSSPDSVLIGCERGNPPNKDFKMLSIKGAGGEMANEHVAIAWGKEESGKPAYLQFNMPSGEFAPVVIFENIGGSFKSKVLAPKPDEIQQWKVYPSTGDLNNIFLILPDKVDHGIPRRAVMINFKRLPHSAGLTIEVKEDDKIAPDLYKKAFIESHKAIPQRTKSV